MSAATGSFRAHFDGQVIVPDEPVSFAVNEALILEAHPSVETPTKQPARENVQEKLAALQRIVTRAEKRNGRPIPAEALRRENMYGDDGR